MKKKADLIQENNELRIRLELAEKWMQREVQTAMQKIQKKEVQSVTRKHFSNFLEEEGIDILARRISDIFGESLQNAPEYTLERLIDAEIYWQTLQKYSTMDGLPIVLAYQKILDAWIEEKLIAPWRLGFSPEKGRSRGVMQRGIPYNITHPNPLLRCNSSPKSGELETFSGRGLETLEKDIQNIISKKYTLSIGRLYQILSLIREGKKMDGILLDLIDFWKKEIPSIFEILISDEFFLPFSELMNREIFTKKRHENKVTFSDVKKTRDILNTLLQLLF